MVTQKVLQELAQQHGTPLFVVDHDQLRRNYSEFKRYMPRVQAYYAVKANSNPEIIRTLFEAGASFDVASMPEFMLVHDNIKDWPPARRQDYIWEKIIYANPIKTPQTLRDLNRYKPLVTYDNMAEVRKVAQYAPEAGMMLRLKVPNTGAMVELSSKFGASPGIAVDLIEYAHDHGLIVEGLSFHVGSQCTNFENYIQALALTAGVFREARSRGFEKLKLIDIGGGFPAKYHSDVLPFRSLAKRLNAEFKRLFPSKEIEILAEPGRFLVASACTSVAEVIGKAERDGKLCYYINDGVYHTFSGTIFDHCHYDVKSFKRGKKVICAVFGPTCDALDTLSLSNVLPRNLQLGDLVYARNIGAYSHASSTYFNGFPPAKVVHVNQ
jgi:ornithine decarboxylase